MVAILAGLERVSLRGIARIFGLSWRTISRWLSQWSPRVPPVASTLLPLEATDVLELDELRSFVGNKAQERWLWLSLCRRTCQVATYWLEDRSENSAIHLWRRFLADYRVCASFSDRWAAYKFVLDRRRHRSVEKRSGETANVERWFNTLRQRLARFTRRTLAFSKRDDLHDGCCDCLSMTTICHVSIKMSQLPVFDPVLAPEALILHMSHNFYIRQRLLK